MANHNQYRRPQHRQHQPSTLQVWLRFFAGHPVRFLWTCAGLLLILSIFRPDLATLVIQRILGAAYTGIAPFIQPAVMILIIAYGFYLMTKPLRGKKKKSDH